jgi:hypothetical protein
MMGQHFVANEVSRHIAFARAADADDGAGFPMRHVPQNIRAQSAAKGERMHSVRRHC